MLLKCNVQVFQILQYCIGERVPNIIGVILTLLNRQSLYLKEISKYKNYKILEIIYIYIVKYAVVDESEEWSSQ